MFVVISVLWGSVAVGYLLRRHPVPGLDRIMTYAVWCMLFLMGTEVGGNTLLMRSLGSLGLEAALLVVFTTLGCSVPALWLWRKARTKAESCPVPADTPPEKGRWRKLFGQLAGSLVIVAFFAAGLVAGHARWLTGIPAGAGFAALCVLLICVGLGIGQNDGLRQSLRHIDRRLMWLPAVTITGTWAGAWVASFLLPARTAADCLAIGSGFGYYSLSGILITEVKGAEMGTLALMYNILRELTALLLAPFLLRVFGPLSPISIGGATTADTTLPVISRVCGPQFVPVSVWHGLAVDFSVPFLVPFFCSL